MNTYSSTLLFSTLLLTACGQTGPLYLPTDNPPIAVVPEKVKKKAKETIMAPIKESESAPKEGVIELEKPAIKKSESAHIKDKTVMPDLKESGIDKDKLGKETKPIVL